MRAAIYTRLAADEVGQAEIGLGVQRGQAEAYAAARGWWMAGAYQDAGYSGTSWTRPALTRLLADAREGGFDVVVVARLDRLMAGTEATLDLLERLSAQGVHVHSVREGVDTSTPEGRHLLHVGRAALGQAERRAYEPSSEPPAVAPGEVVIVERERA